MHGMVEAQGAQFEKDLEEALLYPEQTWLGVEKKQSERFMLRKPVSAREGRHLTYRIRVLRIFV